jgi:hypothetical protein
MNPHVADRLFDELFVAGVAFYLAGKPLSVSLRQQARRHRGATQRMLVKFSELPDLPSRFDQYLQEMQR